MSVARAVLLPLVLVAVAVARTRAASEVGAVMKDYTLGFGQALEKCREETKLTKDVMEEFMHFWNDDFKFDNREFGCAIICMARHYNLITDENRMHHENAVKFFESHPNGALISRETVNLIHECEQRHDSVQDHCWRVVRVAECFKSVCLELNLAPDLDVVVGELIMETTD